jgi:predicted site-specific integrase-resolvase
MSELEKTTIKRVKVKLKMRHTHAGIEYDEMAVKAGVEIEVTEQQAAVLKDQGVI